MATMRLLIALSIIFGLELEQIDVKIIFLNPKLHKDIYIELL